jgi:hypothetical protein
MHPTLNFSALMLFLLIAQAAPPVPRKVSSDARNLSKYRNNNSDAHKSIANPASVQNAIGTRSTENSNQPAATQQKSQHIVVDRLPDRGTLDKVYIYSTIALVLVGAVTFGAVLYQAIKTRDAAEATLLYAKAFIESQRAQIAFAPYGNPVGELFAERPKVQIAMINRGITTAYNLVYESWIEALQFPFEDFTKAADYFKYTSPMVLAPNQEPVPISIPFRAGFTQTQKNDISELRLFVCVRIRASYLDAFKAARYTNYGVYVAGSGLKFLPKYNDAN